MSPLRGGRAGEADEQLLDVARIINCTGPGNDVAGTAEPLLRGLIDSGLARSAPLGIGVDVRADGDVIDANGRADGRLWPSGR